MAGYLKWDLYWCGAADVLEPRVIVAEGEEQREGHKEVKGGKCVCTTDINEVCATVGRKPLTFDNDCQARCA